MVQKIECKFACTHCGASHYKIDLHITDGSDREDFQIALWKLVKRKYRNSQCQVCGVNLLNNIVHISSNPAA